MRVKSSLKIMSLLFLMWVGGVCRKTFLLREESIGRDLFSPFVTPEIESVTLKNYDLNRFVIFFFGRRRS